MNVLFLVAKLSSVEPFGIMSLSPFLCRDGHTVRLIEAEADDVLDQVRAFAPDVVGYSVCTGSHPYYLKLNRYLKSRLSFTSVFGGPHPSFFPEMIAEDGVDAICRGEGDHALPEFCHELERTGDPTAVANFTVKTRAGIQSRDPRPLVRDLDELPIPDRELYYSAAPDLREHRVRSFLATRGCPFACTYCFNRAMDDLYGGLWRRVRTRSPASLVDEIASVTSQYPTEFVAFRESIFPLATEWLAEFADQYAARIRLPFYCHVRLDMLTEANVSLLAKAGCYSVNVGIEAGRETVRRELLDRHMSNQHIRASCNLLRRHRIRILANNMLGLPGCTLDDDLETLKLNQQCRADYSLAMLWQPYPGTWLADYARQNGHYRGDGQDIDFTYYERSRLCFRTEHEKRRIENLQKLFAVAAAVPLLTPIIKWLTHLPPNRLFEAVFQVMYMVFHQTEIFRHRVSWPEWKENLRHIAAGV